MREVTSDYLAQVQGSGRQFGFYVKVYGAAAEPATLWLGDIISIDIMRSISDKLQIGACLSDKLTLQTRATALFGGKGKKIEVFYRCTAPVLGWSRLGTFYVDEAVTKGGVTAVTAYDMMGRLDKKISWVDTSKATAPTFPCKMQAMLKYICDRCGFTTDFTCENITVEKAPDGYTARELISYIAASHGANARFSPSEVLKLINYTQVEKTVQHGRCPFKTSTSAGCSGGVDEVARNGLNAHAANTDIHVTAAQKAAWDGKAELSDIPLKLPADGGNSDTVGNISPAGFICASAARKLTTSLNGSGLVGTFYCEERFTPDYPKDSSGNAYGQYGLLDVRIYGSIFYQTMMFENGTVIHRARIAGVGGWSSWQKLNDGGNAASVGVYTEEKIAALEARIAALEGGT